MNNNELQSISEFQKALEPHEDVLLDFFKVLEVMQYFLSISWIQEQWPGFEKMVGLSIVYYRTETRQSANAFIAGAFSILENEYCNTQLRQVFHTAYETDRNREKLIRAILLTAILRWFAVTIMLRRHPKPELKGILARGSAETSNVVSCLHYWGKLTIQKEELPALPSWLGLNEVREWADALLVTLRKAETAEGARPLIYDAKVDVDGATLILDWSIGIDKKRNRWVTIELNLTSSSAKIRWSSVHNAPSQSLSIERLLAELEPTEYRAVS